MAASLSSIAHPTAFTNTSPTQTHIHTITTAMPTMTSDIALHPLSSLPAYSTEPCSPPPYTPHASIIPLGPSLFDLAPTPESPTRTDDPLFRAALREYQATQDPLNWGKRLTQPQYRSHWREDEQQGGWWGWIRYCVELMAPEIPAGPHGLPVGALGFLPHM